MAARTELPLAQAYSLASRVDDALDAINRNLELGYQLRNPLLIAEALATAEPVVTMHGEVDSAPVLLGWIEMLSAVGFDTPFAVSILVTRANLLRMLNRIPDAATACEQAVDIITTEGERLSPLLAVKVFGAASLIARDNDDLLSSLKAARAIVDLQNRPEVLPHIPVMVRIVNLHNAADAAISAGRLELARTSFTHAQDLASEHGFAETSLVHADNFTIRGRLAHAEGHLEQARSDLENAIAILRALPTSFLPRLPAPLINLAIVLAERGDTTGAIAHAREAHAIDTDIYGCEHPETIRDQNLLDTLTHGPGDPFPATLRSAMAGPAPDGGTASVAGDGMVFVDTEQVMRNIRWAMEQIDADPQSQWVVSDFVSDSELHLLFYQLGMGAAVIRSTLNSTHELLTTRFGPTRAARGIPSAFDVNTVSGDNRPYSRQAHDLAVMLVNTTLAEAPQSSRIRGCSTTSGTPNSSCTPGSSSCASTATSPPRVDARLPSTSTRQKSCGPATPGHSQEVIQKSGLCPIWITGLWPGRLFRRRPWITECVGELTVEEIASLNTRLGLALGL